MGVDMVFKFYWVSLIFRCVYVSFLWRSFTLVDGWTVSPAGFSAWTVSPAGICPDYSVGRFLRPDYSVGRFLRPDFIRWTVSPAGFFPLDGFSGRIFFSSHFTSQIKGMTARRSEGRIKSDLQDAAALEATLLSRDCVPSRSPISGCANQLKCRNKFTGISDVILNFRRELCDGNRRDNLIDRLQNMCHELEGGERVVGFTIEGISVCKTFYRQATGYKRQYFDFLLHCVLNNESPTSRRALAPGEERPLRGRDKAFKVVAILDLIFSQRLIKLDPSRRNHRIHIRRRWREIYYDDFTRYCGGRRICSYDTFVAIRKKYRKDYKTSPRLKKSKRIYIYF